MLFRLVFYCVLAYLAWRFVRWLLAPSRASRDRAARRTAAMVRCETCGMFITQNSALVVGGRDFCSRQCLEQKARRA